MWIFLNDAFMSVVEHRDDSNLLMVRARLPGDLEAVFPDLAPSVQTTPDADYMFRVVVTRERMMQAMIDEVGRIDYFNFKSSVSDCDRHDAYLGVWSVMYRAQNAAAKTARDVKTMLLDFGDVSPM